MHFATLPNFHHAAKFSLNSKLKKKYFKVPHIKTELYSQLQKYYSNSFTNKNEQFNVFDFIHFLVQESIHLGFNVQGTIEQHRLGGILNAADDIVEEYRWKQNRMHVQTRH